METINEILTEKTDYSFDSVSETLSEEDELRSRAFAELIEADIIPSNPSYTEYKLEYNIENMSVAQSKYAVFSNNITYLSWVWVHPDLEDNGIGKIVVQNTINKISNTPSTQIYALAKSDKAEHIFKKYHDFNSASDIPHLTRNI